MKNIFRKQSKGLEEYKIKNTKPTQISAFEDLVLKLGVSVRNSDGTLMKLYDILHDLSEVFAKTVEKIEEEEKIKEEQNKSQLPKITEMITIFDINEIDKQIDYQWIAKSIEDGQYHIGYIFIDKPWYSFEEQWSYHLKYQVDTNRRWEEHIIDRETIKPHTIRNRAWLNSKIGRDTVFITPEYYSFDDNPEKNILGTDIDAIIKNWKGN